MDSPKIIRRSRASGGEFCSVPGCSNARIKCLAEGRRLSFYKFPTEQNRSDLWLAAIRRNKPDGTPWTPSKHSRVCSEHFVKGQKSNDPLNPDYTPSLFPHLSERERQRAKYRHMKYERNQRLNRKRAYALAKGAPPKKASTTTPKPRIAYLRLNIQQEVNDWSEVEHNYCGSSALGSSWPQAVGSVIPSSSQDQRDVTNIQSPQMMLSVPTTFCTNKSCQAALKRMNDECAALRAELSKLRDKVKRFTFSEEAFEGSGEKVRELTGVPSYARLMFLFTIVPSLMKNGFFGLSRFQHLIITLLYLKLNLPFQFFSHVFLTSKWTTLHIFKYTLSAMHGGLSAFIKWPSRERSGTDLSAEFGENRKITAVIDCFEIPLETKPKSVSKHKHLTSMKYIIATTPEGAVSFVSTGWPGEMSDTEIAERCGVLEKLSPGDIVIARCEFDIRDSVSLTGAVLQKPAKGPSAAETVIEQLYNTYALLQGPVHHALCQASGTKKLTCLDEIVSVCCALHNIKHADSQLSREGEDG